MPFDNRPSAPHNAMARQAPRVIVVWLFALCAMILVMVSLGGATRLTGSGLSIMEWAPILGTLPPLSEAEWQRLFALYQKIPQYELVNHGFGLEGFKSIFWLEWAHRLWGRLMGLALAGPLIVFSLRGMISRRLGVRLVLLLGLGGLQGGVGWFMVASGFAADSTAVSAYRLVLHLVLALSLYSAMLWTALGLLPRSRQGRGARWLGLASGALVLLVGVTIIAGGFVAGLKAGLIYNSFPLMDGGLVPGDYGALPSWWRNLFENPAAVQFNHRLLATLVVSAALVVALLGLVQGARGFLRGALLGLGIVACAQYALGVATLLWVVPVSLGTAHQAMAVVLLTAALVLRHAQRAAP
jgi:cytochrome c oxidase assembly protein subunit 15